jgi:hypothetical protein
VVRTWILTPKSYIANKGLELVQSYAMCILDDFNERRT